MKKLYLCALLVSVLVMLGGCNHDDGNANNCNGNCFPNGVAAGDVDQTSVWLWARAAFAGKVRFEYGRDPNFVLPPDGVENVNVKYFGEDDAYFDDKDPDNSPPAKVKLTGLLAGTQYYYRVCRNSCPANVARGTEVHGRFRTPHAGGNHGLRFGVSSCFDGNLRPFVSISNVPGDVVDEDLDFFVALGDTTYADNPDDYVGRRATNLKGFRKKNELVYRQLKSPDSYNPPRDDNMFALARASTAFYATIDDHEVVNNFAGGVLARSQLDTPECNKVVLGAGGLGKCFCNDDFDNNGVVDNPLLDPNCDRLINETDIYQDALKAWHEYNPIREDEYGDTRDNRTKFKKKLYRYRTFGKDAAIFMLDTRSFRDENVTIAGQDQFTLPPQAYLPGRTILGKKQLNDLLRDLRRADRGGITWKFVMVPEPIQHLGIVGAADRFESFAHERAIILDMIETECIDNVVFISGDIHGSVVNNLTYENPADVILGLGGFGNLQRFSYSWDISTGPVAYSPPIGFAVTQPRVDEKDLVPPMDEQDRKNFDTTFRDRMDIQLRVLNRPRTGLGGDVFIYAPPLQQRNKNIPATLIDDNDPATIVNDPPYVSGHSYGWTEFHIDSNQELLVKTYGINWYKPGQLNLDSPPEPKIIGQFRITPFSPANNGENCLFNTDCISCRCSLLTGGGLLKCDAKLPNGSVCATNNQCASDRCRTLICQAKETNGNTCLTNNDCLSDRCRTLICQAKEPSGNPCLTNNDCISGDCVRFQCDAKLSNGSVCARNNQCVSNRCRNLICKAKKPSGSSCLTNNDCISGKCTGLLNRQCS